MKPITVLWFGGGQDSTALLYLLHFSSTWKAKYLGTSELVVIMSDTGNEYPNTYEHIAEVSSFCKVHDIEFHFITPDMGFHSSTWHSLQAQFEKNQNIMSVALPKSCTDKLKITVCYNFLEQLLKVRYGFTGNRKKAFYEYHEKFGKLTCIIGFAKGEESRQSAPEYVQFELFEEFKPPEPAIPVYRKATINQIYPLIEMGLDRADCQEVIQSYGFKVPIPSNCMMCPFQSAPELIYLHRFHRNMWDYWVVRESEKLAKNSDKARNLAVKGNKTLPQALQEAQQKFGHWSDAQLINYRQSHGHCVKSRF